MAALNMRASCPALIAGARPARFVTGARAPAVRRHSLNLHRLRAAGKDAEDKTKEAGNKAGNILEGLKNDIVGNAEEAGDSAKETADTDGPKNTVEKLGDKLGIGEKSDKGTMTTDGKN